jgi:hypothetical protein
MDFLFSKLYSEDKKEFICKCIRTLKRENDEYFHEVRDFLEQLAANEGVGDGEGEGEGESIGNVDVEGGVREIISAIEKMFEDEEDAIEEWKISIAECSYDSFYSFNKDCFVDFLTPEIINMKGVTRRIKELRMDLEDSYYSVMGEMREEEEQLGELAELVEYIADLIEDEDVKADFLDC